MDSSGIDYETAATNSAEAIAKLEGNSGHNRDGICDFIIPAELFDWVNSCNFVVMCELKTLQLKV